MLRLIGVEFFKLRRRWLPYILLLVLVAAIVAPLLITYSNYNSAITKYPELETNGSSEGLGDEPDITIIPRTGSPNIETDIDITVIPGGPALSSEEREKQNLKYKILMWKPALVLPTSMSNVFNIVAGLGQFLVIILAASVVGTEYRWGTLRQILIKGTGRSKYLGAKVLATAIAVIAGVITAVVVGLIISIVTTTLVEGGVNWDNFTFYFFSALGRALIILGVYFAIAVFFTVLFRSASAGMAIALVLFFAESMIVGMLSGSIGWLADITPYTIGRNVEELAMFSPPSLYPEGFHESLARWWRAAGILLAYGLAFMTAAFYAFRRQDITA